MLIISSYAKTEVSASAFEDAVHVDFRIPPEHGQTRQRLGYLSITLEQARALSAELLAAADKAEKYEA